MDGLIEGRRVHYVLTEQDSQRHPGEHRPADVVRVVSKEEGTANLYVLVDGTNDVSTEGLGSEAGPPVLWRTSVRFDEETKEPGTWHWLEPA